MCKMLSSTFVVLMSLMAVFHVAQFAELRRKGQDFLTKEELERRDDVESPRHAIVFPDDVDRGICDLPADTGHCRAAFKKIYYDRVAGHCKQFTYGGCGGNDNRFDTVGECHSKCGH